MDEAKAEHFVGYASAAARTTFGEKVPEGIGNFAGFFDMQGLGYRDPLLVGACDGVGTKVLLAETLGSYRGIGIDLVGMNVNDIAATGARPLFFLDYLAVGALRGARERRIIDGVVRGCRLAGCALIGGETAQMKPVYGERGLDLAAFCVGAVERSKVIGAGSVKPGDILVGIASSGLHSNGFSLVNRLYGDRTKLRERRECLGSTLGAELLRPTRIYAALVAGLAESSLVTGAAHITGGGIPGNLVRILPRRARAAVEKGSWDVPPVFPMIARDGSVSEREMYRVFNMGLGMILACRPEKVDPVRARIRRAGMTAWIVGGVKRGERSVVIA